MSLERRLMASFPLLSVCPIATLVSRFQDYSHETSVVVQGAVVAEVEKGAVVLGVETGAAERAGVPTINLLLDIRLG